MKPEFRSETKKTIPPERLKMIVLGRGAFLYTKEEIDPEEMKEDPESKYTFLTAPNWYLLKKSIEGYFKRRISKK